MAEAARIRSLPEAVRVFGNGLFTCFFRCFGFCFIELTNVSTQIVNIVRKYIKLDYTVPGLRRVRTQCLLLIH